MPKRFYRTVNDADCLAKSGIVLIVVMIVMAVIHTGWLGQIVALILDSLVIRAR